MRALRSIAIVILACLGLVAAGAAVLWAGSLAGLVRAEVVSTSAMAPRFDAGDLVIVTSRPAAELAEGDVVSVRGAAGSGHLERVVAIERRSADSWTVTTVASSAGTETERTVGDDAWAPTVRVPVVGGIIAGATQPSYAIPGIAIVLLLAAVALIGRSPTAPVRRTA